MRPIRKTVELLLNPALADSIAAAGYSNALENYSWDPSAAKLETTLQGLPNGKSLIVTLSFLLSPNALS
jgi:hypothetical protein